MNLPPPSPEARIHSERVAAHVSRLLERDGWLSFADYMAEVLYAPGLGYYASGTRKFGADGDFVTAPELSRLFGRCIAHQLADIGRHVSDGDVIELGPGSGRLAADVLEELCAQAALPQRYRLLEVSPDLAERQRNELRNRVPDFFGRIDWIAAPPEQWRGAVIANEVLDAVPPHIVARQGGVWFERGVTLNRDGELTFADRALSDGALATAAKELFPAEGDYVSEINPAAQALVTELARRCSVGAVLILDYGFPAAEYYHPQRRSGTLMAHYRHHTLSDPFFLPGLCDLTAHVDFSAVARAGVASGMHVAGYTTQARFLVNCGILEELAGCGDPRSISYLREVAALQKLLSPTEMGELIKVLALTRGVEAELLGFRDGDRSHRL